MLWAHIGMLWNLDQVELALGILLACWRYIFQLLYSFMSFLVLIRQIFCNTALHLGIGNQMWL